MTAQPVRRRSPAQSRSKSVIAQPHALGLNGHATGAELGADGVLPAVELLAVLRALRGGDFSVSLPRGHTGVAGDIAQALNGVIELNRRLASELQRMSASVGKDGRLTQRVSLPGSRGEWESCIEAVNALVDDLVRPTTEVRRVIGAVASGDLTTTMALDIDGRPLQGEFLSTANLVNGMVQQLGSFASEVTRVAREVGTEGNLGGQANVPGVAGTWKDLTDNVNTMANNLTAQVRNIAEVTTAVAKGDLSKKITVDVKGEILQLKNTINTMVDQLNSFASEVTRVAREVGTEGKLGGQAKVKGIAGTWKDLTEGVNSMASNLTAQVRNIAEVTTAVAKGNLSKKITVNVEGEMLQLKNTINTMVDQLNSFASEVTRVAREVGTEGKLGGQAQVPGVGGTWKDLTDSVNSMASNLTTQVRNIAEVTTAVAKGDFTKKITVTVRGELSEMKKTVNSTVDQLSALANEVTRVAREVGTEGKLGGQAIVPGVSGTWKDLTDSVNSMAGNLTDQVRNIADVTTAVAKGDLSRKITVDVRGEIWELKDTINTMVDQLNAFAEEVTRVAREVGTEGKLGGQAKVRGVAGIWKDLTDSVNSMAGNLTAQVRNVAEVTTAVADGDLSKKITVDVQGEMLQLKNTINTMVDQLNAFANEVTRVAREVGSEGKLGGQAKVPGVSGTWKDLTDSVNSMASNLTAQVRNIAEVTTAVARGDLSRKITVDARGEIVRLKDTINTMVDQLNAFAREVTRVAREVGTEGELGGQAWVQGVAGIWKDLTDGVNSMANNLTAQVRNIAEVTTAVARGDLSRKITVDVKGEILELKNTINTMVDQLNAFASEVTRVAREVGTEGMLGGQARVPGVAGIWMDLTGNVNSMASNLTNQVRGIAKVVTSVANGDLTRKLALDARGEIAELAETINGMTDTLAVFSEQVVTVAREVGVQGKLGGQARVPGAAGTWRDLTDNVNQLAANLSTQVRAIGDVATAVTSGDLTRYINVEASGEVAALKDHINEMIRNLKETTQKTKEQDWLKTNLARFSRMLQGQRDLVTVAQLILSELTRLVAAPHGLFYMADIGEDGEVTLRLLASYAAGGDVKDEVRPGEGLIGQCALEKRMRVIRSVPPAYLGVPGGDAGIPMSLVVLPVLFEGQINAVIQFASFESLSLVHEDFLAQLTEGIGVGLNTIAASMRTERLLQQSQLLTRELQSQQEELRETNDRLELQATTLRMSEERLRQQQEEMQQTNDQLGEKAKLLQVKNQEVELARTELEEKAEQLALTSRYKSQFLANMSHELRTPLNSLLILSSMLSENREGNLSAQQVEFIKTVHSAGTDLLALITDILDLSKIESGTITVEAEKVRVSDLIDYVEQTFRYVAQQRGLTFRIEIATESPETIVADAKRLQQVLRNLLSNAFKFTEEGSVTLRVHIAREGWQRDNASLNRAGRVVAFSVSDTGVGIAEEKQRIIFEAFQQADGTTSRRYGGTGLGLSISRELAKLLGGELRVVSKLGEGSTFTLYVAEEYSPDNATLVVEDRQTEPSAGVPAANENLRPVKVTHVSHVDDRHAIEARDRVLLIVADDVPFAQALLQAARRAGFKGVIAGDPTLAVGLAIRYGVSAAAVDTEDAQLDGWCVLERLKRDARLRHFPVAAFSHPSDASRARKMGALRFIAKPAAQDQLDLAIEDLASFARRPRPRLLLASPEFEKDYIEELVRTEGMEIATVHSAAALEALIRVDAFDCLVLDLSLLDSHSTPASLRIQSLSPHLAIIAHTRKELSRAEVAALEREVDALVQWWVDGAEKLLKWSTLFLHTPLTILSDEQRAALIRGGSVQEELNGTKVLVVDDDIRNIFAMTSALERRGARVVCAENGRAGLEILEGGEDVDVVMVDVMMPEMDGYEVMRRIRADGRFQDLPVIAVTAKAMSADREKCIASGATDYMSKPVDIDRLLTLLRLRLMH
jgi:HAMP domain-containing protein/signal transduction histidine kinase/DNA-binding response OmpR family regulator